MSNATRALVQHLYNPGDEATELRAALRVRIGLDDFIGTFGQQTATDLALINEKYTTANELLTEATALSTVIAYTADTIANQALGVAQAASDIEEMYQALLTGGILPTGAQIENAPAKTTPVGADYLAFIDSANDFDLVKISFTNLTSTLTTSITSSLSAIYAPIVHTHAYSTLTGKPTLGTAAAKDAGLGAGNVLLLDGSGMIDVSVIPAVAITDTFVVASQVAMLALTAQKGDIAIRSDLNKSFSLATNSPSTLADWKELLTPTDAVLSVAGLTGAISAAALKTALAIAVADITDMSVNGRSLVSAANYAGMRTLLGLVPGTDVQAYDADLASIAALNGAANKMLYATGANTWALADLTSFGRSLVDDADAAAGRATLGLGSSSVLPEMSTAEYIANTSGKVLTTDKVWAAAAFVNLGTTLTGTQTWNFSTFIHAKGTMTGSITLGQPTSPKEGQMGTIRLLQDATGGRTISVNTTYAETNGNAALTITTTASTTTILSYQVQPNGKVLYAVVATGIT